MADIDRVYGITTSTTSDPNKSRKQQQNIRKPTIKGDDIDDGYDASNNTGGDGSNTDISNRANNVRQSKSANAARSLTRKNQ